MSQFIFVMRKRYSNDCNDYRFMNKAALKDILKSGTCTISDHQFGFINPENDELCIHQLDTNTLEVMFNGDE